ncbi:MAG: ABC transporter ATP-binding protein [Herpetosiphonaceae bacterium]|nr:ABC transporter ATP-binding protein [Herpetosiphonaceae bacterium]
MRNGRSTPDAYRLLWHYLAPQSGAALLMSGLLLASIGLQLVGPHVASTFIDAARGRAAEARLVQLALVFVGVALAQQALLVLATYWSERVAWTATNALRADLAAHLLRLDLGFHKLHTPGELIERVDGDVNALAGFFSSFVVQLVGSVLLLIGVLVAVAFVDARLGFAFTAFAAVALVLLGWVRRFGTPHWRAEREQSAAFYGYVGEVLTATEDLRSNGAVPYALHRFFGHLRTWLPIGLRANLWGNMVWVTAAVLFAIGDALAYGLGGSLFQSQTISLGAVYLVVAYAAMLAAPLETIRTQMQDLQRADASVARVRELLLACSALEDGTAELPAGALGVEFQRVRFGYDDGAGAATERAVVLDDLSFTLRAGRVLGLLGRTGSGKTTAARLLFRLYDPQVGEVYVGGVAVRQARLAALRERVGLVTQDVQLFEATLRDNLTFFDSRVVDERLLTVLDTLGLRDWLERLPDGLDTPISGGSLSAGEAQLLALARVFIKDPGLVILDEASSRLDPATEALLERALDRLLHADCTVIIIAHRMQTVERADDILILEDGRIREYGSRALLAADPASRFAALRRAGHGEVLA